MKKFNFKEIFIPSFSLFLICVIVSAILAVTNSVTAPKIEQLAQETEVATRKLVLPDAESFGDAKEVNLDGNTYTYFEGLDKENNVIGFVFTTVSKGYGGDVKIMTGISSDGTVAGIETLELSETAGLGMNAQNPEFKEQFKGKNSKIEVVKSNATDNQITALTGATITSNAVTTAVNTALSLYSEIGGAN